MKTRVAPLCLGLLFADCALRAHAFRAGLGLAAQRPHARAVRPLRCAAGDEENAKKKSVLVVGAGWGGLGVAWHLSKRDDVAVTLVDAAPKVGGLIRDGFQTKQGRPCEAGMHGFWDEYKNIFNLVDNELGLEDVFTDYALQGQYSPRGLEAIWPIYRNEVQLPTGLGQALFTRFINLPATDLATAVPLVAAFSEMLSSDDAFDRSRWAWFTRTVPYPTVP